VKYCGSVPLEVHNFFHRSLEKKRMKQRERLLREKIVAEASMIHEIDSNNDEQLSCDLPASHREKEYAIGSELLSMLKRVNLLKGKMFVHAN
jgi:hypothetical protein